VTSDTRIPARPADPWYRNIWFQRISLSLLIVILVLGWHVYRRGWWFLYPSMPAFESVRQDDAPAHKLAKALDIPEPPDLTQIDEKAAHNFYVALHNAGKQPAEAKHYGILGRVFEAEGMNEAALQLYERAMRMDDDDHAWPYHAALVSEKMGRAPQAAEFFRKSIALKPDYAPAYLRLGNILLDEGRTEEAEAQFRKYLQLRPHDIYGHLAMARAAHARQDWNMVVEQVLAAQDVGEVGRQGHELLAKAYTELGETDRAREELAAIQQAGMTTAVLDDPLAAAVQALRTGMENLEQKYAALFAQGRYDEALDVAKQLHQKTAGTTKEAESKTLLAIAECNIRLGRREDALDAVMHALELTPARPETHGLHSMIRLSIGDYITALREAQNTIQLDRNYIKGYWLRGQALLSLASQDPVALQKAGLTVPPMQIVNDAVVDLAKSAENETRPYDIELFYGMGLAMQGNYEQAAGVFERALQQYPQLPAARRLLDAARAKDESVFWPAGKPTAQTQTAPAGPTATAPVTATAPGG
jgi:tetratricopeptide (TPR) repeat protein